MNGQWIILLSGTSSSGKTTIARALAKRLSTESRPFLSVEADKYLPHLPDDWSHATFGSSLSEHFTGRSLPLQGKVSILLLTEFWRMAIVTVLQTRWRSFRRFDFVTLG